ncbi:MAG: TerD family protein [Bacteroidales bacterium]|nr:TerD family protein [Bacteroidales bacterium]
MAIRLEKGQRINLEKTDGKKLTNFCVGCNWGAIVVEKPGFLGLGTKKEEIDVDIDLSCVMTDENGQLVDTLYSPLYNPSIFKSVGLPIGKDWSTDRSMYHTPDDTEGDKGGDDGLDNEIITVNLQKVNPNISQIFFFLNIYEPRDIDFLKIPYATIRMFEGTPERVNSVFAQYDVAKTHGFANKNALIMGKLYRRNGEWKFAAIGDAFDDHYNLLNTVKRILTNYSK